MKLGTYIMAPETMSTAYFINPSFQSVCLYVYPLVVTRQRLCKNITVAKNTHATIEELLVVPFPIRSLSYKKKNKRLVLRNSLF
jgi:hypothetical protein